MAFWLLRFWLAARAIGTGLTKFIGKVNGEIPNPEYEAKIKEAMADGLSRSEAAELVTDIPEKISGTITSSYYEEGNDGGLYLDFTDSLPNLTNVTINRNPVGKITLNLSSYTQASSGYYCASLFSNPGPDTHVYIQRTHANDSEHGSCIYFNGRILATEGKNSAELTFKEGVSSYVLPRCCSEDDGCPESIWNGSVKCTGKAKCYVSDDYKLPLNSSDRTECSD